VRRESEVSLARRSCGVFAVGTANQTPSRALAVRDESGSICDGMS
jgi:hypothetical protein